MVVSPVELIVVVVSFVAFMSWAVSNVHLAVRVHHIVVTLDIWTRCAHREVGVSAYARERRRDATDIGKHCQAKGLVVLWFDLKSREFDKGAASSGRLVLALLDTDDRRECNFTSNLAIFGLLCSSSIPSQERLHLLFMTDRYSSLCRSSLAIYNQLYNPRYFWVGGDARLRKAMCSPPVVAVIY